MKTERLQVLTARLKLGTYAFLVKPVRLVL